MKWLPVRHAHVQYAVTTLVARPQFGVHALDSFILLQELQLFLQRVDLQRCAGSEFDPVVQVRVGEPAVALDVDPCQLSLDDMDGNDAGFDSYNFV